MQNKSRARKHAKSACFQRVKFYFSQNGSVHGHILLSLSVRFRSSFAFLLGLVFLPVDRVAAIAPTCPVVQRVNVNRFSAVNTFYLFYFLRCIRSATVTVFLVAVFIILYKFAAFRAPYEILTNPVKVFIAKIPEVANEEFLFAIIINEQNFDVQIIHSFREFN